MQMTKIPTAICPST